MHSKSAKKRSMHLLHPHQEVSCWKKGNSSPSRTNILLSALLNQTPQCLPQDHVLLTPPDCTRMGGSDGDDTSDVDVGSGDEFGIILD